MSIDDYVCYYFPADYSVISDREISFARSSSQNSSYLRFFTYRFDEAGNLTEIVIKRIDPFVYGDGNISITHYIITDTPESEIQSWVEQVAAQS